MGNAPDARIAIEAFQKRIFCRLLQHELRAERLRNLAREARLADADRHLRPRCTDAARRHAPPPRDACLRQTRAAGARHCRGRARAASAQCRPAAAARTPARQCPGAARSVPPDARLCPPNTSRSRSRVRGPQRSVRCRPARSRCRESPAAAPRATSCVSKPAAALMKSSCATGPKGLRAIQTRARDQPRRRQRSQRGEGLAHLREGIRKIAADSDVGRRPAVHSPPAGRRRRRDAGGADDCRRNLSGSPRAPLLRSSVSAISLRSSLPTCWMRVHHSADSRGAMPICGAQQQQVESRAESRLFEQAQCAAAARMFQLRLQREHLAQAQREALRNLHMFLRRADRVIAAIENRADLATTSPAAVARCRRRSARTAAA